MKHIDNLPTNVCSEADKMGVIKIRNAAFPVWEDVQVGASIGRRATNSGVDRDSVLHVHRMLMAGKMRAPGRAHAFLPRYMGSIADQNRRFSDNDS